MRTYIFIILQACLAIAYASPFSQFSGKDYQSQTAQEKMDQLWKQITADTTPHGWYSALTAGTIFLEHMKPTFDTFSDVLPDGRKKLVHSVGCVAKARFVAEEGNPYTGMFQGASNVIIRISTGKEADVSKPPAENFIPGLGIKLLRDGLPSANLVAMDSAHGRDSFNILKNDWSNHIPGAVVLSLALLGKKFSQATPYIGSIGLKTWAQYDEKGNYVDKLNIPFKLVFRPTSEVNTLFPDEYQKDFTEQLKTIPADTKLLDILAAAEPDAELVKIGTVQTTSEFVTSKFGDKNLFFQHNYMEDDVALHPNWEDAAKVDPSIMPLILKYFHHEL